MATNRGLVRFSRCASIALFALSFIGVARAQIPIRVFVGTSNYDFLGFAMDPAGDVDGDGRGDLLAGALGYTAGPHVDLISGATGVVLRSFSIAQLGSCAGAGDVDADGTPDVIVGDMGDATLGPHSGRAVVYSGLTGVVLHAFTGASGGDWFGVAVDGAGVIFGDGLRCVAGTVIRLINRPATNGVVEFGAGVSGDPSVSVRGLVPAAGGARHYQVFYRNTQTFCTSATFNQTNGFSIAWSS